MKKILVILSFFLILILIFVVSGLVTFKMLPKKSEPVIGEEPSENVSLPVENVVIDTTVEVAVPDEVEKVEDEPAVVQQDGVLTIVTPSLDGAEVRYGTKATLIPERVIVSNISDPDVGVFKEDYLPKEEEKKEDDSEKKADDKDEEKKEEVKKEDEKKSEAKEDKKEDEKKSDAKAEDKKEEVKKEDEKKSEAEEDDKKKEDVKREEKAEEKKETEKVEKEEAEEKKEPEKVEVKKEEEKEEVKEEKPQLNPNIQTSDSGL